MKMKNKHEFKTNIQKDIHKRMAYISHNEKQIKDCEEKFTKE